MTPKTMTSAVASARSTPTVPSKRACSRATSTPTPMRCSLRVADALGLEVLGAERLDDRHRATSASLATLAQIALVAALPAGALADLAAEDEADDDQQRRGDEASSASTGSMNSSTTRHADRQQRRLHHLAERVAEQLAHVVDVLGHAREQVALVACAGGRRG